MSVLFPTAGGTPDDLVDAARRLADDLARLAARAGPAPSVLAAAPILDFWQPSVRPTGALVGVVTGHPNIVAGHTALTTDLFAIDAEGAWARTWSRFYRLGRAGARTDGRLQ